MRDGWTETTLGDVAELISRGRAPSYCEDDGVIVLNQKCVRNGRILFEFARRTDISKKAIPEWAYLMAGDTLINSTGVGTLGRASFVSHLNGPTTFDSHVTLVRPRPNSCLPSFIGLNLNFRETEIEMFAGGSTGQTELSREAVNAFPISLPPLVVQKRIVDVVSSADAYIDALQQQAETARTARNAVLHELLESVSSAPQKKLKDLTSKIGSGATPRGGEAVYQESGVSLIRSQNVHNGRFLHEGLVSISDSAARALDGVSVEGNDVLINITGASVARACMVDASILTARVNQHVAILRTNGNQFLPGFLLQILLGKKMNSYLLDISGSGTTRQAITKAQLEDLEVSIPPLVEQKRIVEIVSSMDDVIRTTEQAVADAMNLRSGLLSDLLSGEHEIPASYDVFVGAA